MIHIRPARDPEDAPAVRGLQGQEHLLRVCRPLPAGIYLAELKGAVVGLIELSVDDELPELNEDERGTWIQGIIVCPSLRSRGIGSSLLAHAEKVTRESDQRIIACQPSSDGDYERRLRFFQSHGFNDETPLEREPCWVKRLSDEH